MPAAPIDHDYTVPLDEWVASLPQGRSVMTTNGYAALLRHLLSGGDVPYYSGIPDGASVLLADLHLSHANDVGRLRDRLEFAEITAARTAPAVSAIWDLIFTAGSRKTLPVADVRRTLEEHRG